MTIPRPALALGLGIVLLFDVLRVFLPSLITLFGRAGETPAEQMGLYAALWFALPYLAAFLRPRWSLYGGAALLVVCRLLLQAGFSQLYIASLGVTAGLIFLYGCARTLPRAAVPAGIIGGLSFSVVVHLLLDNVDLVWRPGLPPWLGAITLCAAFLLNLRQDPSDDLAPSATWFLLGPSMLLAGMFALVPESLPHAAAIALGALLLLAALTIVCARGSSGRRPGAAVLSGMVVFLVATFLYYAAYDIDLGFPNTAVPIAVAGLVVGVTLAAARGPGAGLPGGRRAGVVAGACALAFVVLAGLTGLRSEPAVQAKQGDTFTLIAYNIRMGFGLDGRLSLDKIAGWAAARKPDVVLLSEVDRGWLLNGGHDDLARIARGLGMRFYFAPAADPLWGDALLTNLPVKHVASHKLGKHDYPTGAQAQTIVLEVGGKEVGIVNTHLQAPPGQAPEVVALVKDLAVGRPVILAGDLNTTHADPQMKVLEAAGLSDPLTALGDPPTSPADNPTQRIDHVLLTKGLTALRAEVPRVPYSDHLPVVTTLRITTVHQGG